MAQQKQPSCQALNGRTNDKERLTRALDALEHNYCIRNQHGERMAMLQTPDDYYFIERTLIELGYLRGNKNMTAHKAFLDLMDELGFTWRLGRPNSHQLARGAACIEAKPFPWVAADNKEGHEYADDLPRRCDIFRILQGTT